MELQQATFYFYTGTGNSYRVATWLAGCAGQAGAAVTVRPIQAARPLEEVGRGETALVGLVMPTHGFTTPWAMLRFALGLPHRPGTRAMVVATRAGSRVGSTYTPGFEGTATLVLALILLLKGYQVRATAGIDMPSNWLAVHPGLAPATVAGIVARAEERTERLMATVLAGERHYTWTTFLLGLLLLPVSLLYLLIGRHFLARLFFASEQCTECGLCAENCPHGAIELLRRGEGIQPYWTYRCESCMRCIAYCPTEAVEASYVLGAGAYALAAALPLSAVLGWLAVRLPVLAGLRRAPRWITDRASVFAALALLYPIVTLLLRHRGFNRLYTRAAPTHYYRRYHEPGTRLKNLR